MPTIGVGRPGKLHRADSRNDALQLAWLDTVVTFGPALAQRRAL
jgi:hypothetical protein